MTKPPLRRIVLLLGAAALSLPACASSSKRPPKREKKRDIILKTEYDDARLGREASKQVAVQMGVMDNSELDAYVNRIGRKLLRGIPRASFQYEFSVVDQEEPNAFALPGGYIFISRGLLALANTADELACVIGHEITHAAHRHSAAQQEMRNRMIPILSGWRGAMNLAAYGRDMERDADKGGQILCAAAGYDPMGMSTFLKSLGQLERLRRGASRNPSFFDTHPGSTERAATTAARAHELRRKRDPSSGDTRASLLRETNGIAVGQRPEAGIFVGEQFLHPELDFKLRFPHGWRTQNTNTAVGAMEPRGKAVVFLQADQPPGPARQRAEEHVAKTMEEAPIKVGDSKPVKVGSIDAWRVLVKGSGRGGSVSALMTFIPYGSATWRITGASSTAAQKRFLGRTLQTARSFRPLTVEDRRQIKSDRLRVVRARPGETLEALNRRSGSGWDISTAAVYNGIFSDHRYDGGEQVKIIQVEPYVPKKRPAPSVR